MSRSRYGTFLESYGGEKTELRTMEWEYSGGVERISEMGSSFPHSKYPMLHRDGSLVRNRLPLLYRNILKRLSNNGISGILICLHLAIIGLTSLAFTTKYSIWHYIAHYLFSCGMYGFTGGCINYLAVTMLFKKVCGLCGSGIFNRYYEDICESVRTSVIDIFFDEAFLEMCSKQKLGHQLVRLNIEGQLQSILQSQTVDQLINTELNKLATSPEGNLLSCAGVNVFSLKPLVKPFVVDLVAEAIPPLMESFSTYSQDTGIQRLRQEIKCYTNKRKTEVTAERVVTLTREMMYKHLSLLVVLGCVVGFFLGIISQLVGVGRILYH